MGVSLAPLANQPFGYTVYRYASTLFRLANHATKLCAESTGDMCRVEKHFQFSLCSTSPKKAKHISAKRHNAEATL